MIRLSLITVLLVAILAPTFAGAQGSVDDQIQAVITGPSEVAVGRTIVLDASASRTASGTVTYTWYQDRFPQSISRSVEALFTPEEPGEYVLRLVVRQSIDGETFESEIKKTITAYARKIVLITDQSFSDEKLAVHAETAHENGVFLPIIRPTVAAVPLGTEESLTQLLSDQFDRLASADAIVLWTEEPVAGMQALMRAARSDEQRLLSLQSQSLVIITERSLNTLARAIRGPFSVIQPKELFLTRKESLNPLIKAQSMEMFSEVLSTRDIDFVLQDASSLSIKPWNILSSLVNFMLTHGVSSQTIILLLMLPVIATILAFLKQFVGVTTFGLYAPSIIALSFLALGWQIGIVLLTFILAASYISRRILRKWRLLHIPKIAIIITVVSLTLLVVLALGARIGIVLTADTIFVLLIMSTLAESFVTLESAEGWLSALYGVIETVLAALLCVFIVRWSVLQSFILAYPESILTTVVLNALLGRYTGLRLVEYFRFRTVFKHIQEE